MDIIESKNFLIRNYTGDDLPILNKLMEEETSSLEDRNEFLTTFHNSFNDDLDCDGEKNFAIEKDKQIVGRLSLYLNSPYIYLSFTLYKPHDTRTFYQELILVVVTYLHKLYSHRQIITYSSKFDLLIRSVLENYGFIIKSIDKNSNIYEYSIFVANPSKEIK